MQHPLGRRGKTAGGGKTVDTDVAVERPIGRDGHLAGQLIDRENAVEIEQPHQSAAIVGVEPAADAYDRRLGVRRRAGRLAVQGQTQRPERAAKVELGDAAGRAAGFAGAVDGQDAVHFRRRQAVDERTERIRDPGRIAAGDIGETGKRRRIDVERELAARSRRQFVDAAADVDRGAAEIADRQPVDTQDAGIELDAGVDRSRLDAGERRLADIEHERDVTRHFEAAVRGGRLGERRQRIDVELRRA